MLEQMCFLLSGHGASQVTTLSMALLFKLQLDSGDQTHPLSHESHERLIPASSADAECDIGSAFNLKKIVLLQNGPLSFRLEGTIHTVVTHKHTK